MVKKVIGNLLDSDCDYICHQVNCQGVMGSGIAKQIRERWPKVYERYRCEYETRLRNGRNPEEMLGGIYIVPVDEFSKRVINLYSQRTYGYDGKRYTSYDAFASCLEEIRKFISPGCSIGFPKNIGCGLGGAKWNVIDALIEETLGEDYDVYIYEYFGI